MNEWDEATVNVQAQAAVEEAQGGQPAGSRLRCWLNLQESRENTAA
jgi:hypothetical protein